MGIDEKAEISEPASRARRPRPANARKRTSADLLDYAQVADRLNISEATVRRLVDRGMLKSVSVSPSGRKRMVRAVDLDEYLESNANYAATPDPSRTVRPAAVDVALRRAGWDGKDRLAYDREPRK